MEHAIETLLNDFEHGKLNFKSYHVLDPDGWDLQISNQTKQG